MRDDLYDRLVEAVRQAVEDEFDQMAEDGIPEADIEAARNEFLWEASNSGPRED
jgi:frataxin-like iron-binding protein CyaY